MAENDTSEQPIVAFVSYSMDSEEHQDRVLALSDRLRQDGFEIILDQYIVPQQNWLVWMGDAVRISKFVLMICTESYAAKWGGREPSGSRWESQLIEGQMSISGPRADAKFIPVFFDKVDLSHLPMSLLAASRYVLYEQYADLCSHMRGQPRADRRKEQTLKSRPPQSRTIDFIRPWYVPFPRDPLFKGGDGMLREIHEALDTRQPIVIESSQLPLIGGHHLALEYVYQHKQDYSAIFWLDASAEHLGQAFIEIARMLNLGEAASAGEDLARSGFIQWLRINHKWLLVLEGGWQFNEASDFLSLGECGSVVVSAEASSKQWPAGVKVVSFADPQDEGAHHTPTAVTLPILDRSRAAKVFVSFRRLDALEIAEQLLTALSQRGFDVAQERFLLPPGTDFQALLLRELGESEVLIVIESPTASASHWLALEVDFAKRYRMGIVAITLPGGALLTGIANRSRIMLAEGDLDMDGGVLASRLEWLIAAIEREHALAIERRQRGCRGDIEAALLTTGLTAKQWDADGFLHVWSGAKSQAIVSVQPRAATVHDLYQLQQRSSPGMVPYLISQIPAIQPEIEWVAQLAGVRLSNSSRDLATELAGTYGSRLVGSRLRSQFVLVTAGLSRQSADDEMADEFNGRIHSAIVSLTKSVLAESGRIVSAGPPDVLRPMITTAADFVQFGRSMIEDAPLHIYLSRFFEQKVMTEDLELAYRQRIATINWTEAVPGELRMSVDRLRNWMVAETRPVAMVCFGGSEGLIAEVQIFRRDSPRAPVFVFETTGGAAATIAGQDWPFVRVFDREFVKEWSGLYPGDQAYPVEYAYPVMMQALVDEVANPSIRL